MTIKNTQILSKFQVKWMKIDNFRNDYVDFLADVDVLAYVDLKNMCSLNSIARYTNPLQISSEWDEN